ncbi:unnamed protein product [Durusdinium trenchii]|uniref:Uncharacterized protein n=1 Tax=Durusdinium trenchii TaxID=1381693 RepID=A0ABP0PWD1_9DINO
MMHVLWWCKKFLYRFYSSHKSPHQYRHPSPAGGDGRHWIALHPLHCSPSSRRRSLHPFGWRSVSEKQFRLERNLTTALELAHRTAEAAAMLQNDVPEPQPPEEPLPPEELFQTLDDLSMVESPSRSSKTVEELDLCADTMSRLIEKVAHIDGVLQAEIESDEVNLDIQETPAEAVAKNPGPALMAAREVPTLFKELDGHLPRSKLKAYDVLLRAGAVEIHRYVEEQMHGALDRRDDGLQWAQKVLNKKDRNPAGHSQWCKRALQKLGGEREDRRILFGLGADGVFK